MCDMIEGRWFETYVLYVCKPWIRVGWDGVRRRRVRSVYTLSLKGLMVCGCLVAVVCGIFAMALVWCKTSDVWQRCGLGWGKVDGDMHPMRGSGEWEGYTSRPHPYCMV